MLEFILIFKVSDNCMFISVNFLDHNSYFISSQTGFIVFI